MADGRHYRRTDEVDFPLKQPRTGSVVRSGVGRSADTESVGQHFCDVDANGGTREQGKVVPVVEPSYALCRSAELRADSLEGVVNVFCVHDIPVPY